MPLGTIYKTPCLIASLSPSMTNALLAVVLGEFFLTLGDSSPNSQRVLAAQRSRDGSGSSLVCGSPDAVARLPLAPRLCGLQGVTDTRFGAEMCSSCSSLCSRGHRCCQGFLRSPPCQQRAAGLHFVLLALSISPSSVSLCSQHIQHSSSWPILKMTLQSECFGKFLL